MRYPTLKAKFDINGFKLVVLLKEGFMKWKIYLFVVLTPLAIGCETDAQGQKNEGTVNLSQEFKDYWYSGEAEISSYTLKQARYGEIHEGTAVLIFVTEDFSKSKQVKLDDPAAAGDDKVSVMKLNLTKKFNTGIYPYSIMLSVFSPLPYEGHQPLKATMSAQEWCGQVFTQMNLENNHYRVKQYSYFESEGDKEFSVNAEAISEDGIWSRIRINPDDLPTGLISVIPGLITTRLTHKSIDPIEAEAELKKEGNENTYRLRYKTGAELVITFSIDFPHQIIRWEEVVMSSNGKKLTTSATLNETLNIDYWTKNQKKHLYLRDSLKLD